MVDQACLMASISSAFEEYCFPDSYTFLASHPHTFSIKFKSGEYGGHSRTSTFCALIHDFTDRAV